MGLDWWQLLLGIGGFLTPVVLTVMARDRALLTMIGQIQTGMQAMIKAATDPIHERINRVRDEYVREDHLNGHLMRIEKRFDDMATEQRRRIGGQAPHAGVRRGR
ncbi:hypothetical protein [Reyranella sp.]|uniref:hypothetical protein n=1 Tax=Reyranella sp. TaxID=1929291 RepID=UPI003D0E989C